MQSYDDVYANGQDGTVAAEVASRTRSVDSSADDRNEAQAAAITEYACDTRKASAALEGSRLLDKVEDHIGHYVAFPGEHERVAATLWTAHAHALDAFDSTPRLAALSPEPGSGKTRLLEVLDTLTPEPMHVLSASTAAVFRTIATSRPTLLLDEVDSIFGRYGKDENNEDLRALLNAGHRNGATIPRCTGPLHEVRKFPVFAAVALAGLGDLPVTLLSRSVVIRMRRRAPHEHVAPFRIRHDVPLGHRLRDQLAAWAQEVADNLRAVPVMPAGVEDRPADVWEPLVAVADAAGGSWPARAREACSALASSGLSREASLGVRLLTDLRDVFGDEDKMATATILEQLHAIEEAPWGNLHGTPLDARGLSWRLGAYQVSSTKVRLGDRSLQGYRREDLWDAWERYCPSALPVEGEHAEQAERARSDVTARVPEQAPQPEREATPLTRGVPDVPQVPAPSTPQRYDARLEP